MLIRHLWLLVLYSSIQTLDPGPNAACRVYDLQAGKQKRAQAQHVNADMHKS